MTRTKFIILLLIPLLLIIPLLAGDIPGTLAILIFILTCIYIWVLQILRLRYVGFSWKESFQVFAAGSLTRRWWRIWEKDPEDQHTQS